MSCQKLKKRAAVKWEVGVAPTWVSARGSMSGASHKKKALLSRCSMLQCVAVCVEMCVAVWLSGTNMGIRQGFNVRCATKKVPLLRWGVLQCVAVYCSVLQCVAVCCSMLQCVAVCCSVTFRRQHGHQPRGASVFFCVSHILRHFHSYFCLLLIRHILWRTWHVHKSSSAPPLSCLTTPPPPPPFFFGVQIDGGLIAK